MISRNLVTRVSGETYTACMRDAQRLSERVRSATTPADEIVAVDYFLSYDGRSGFAIDDTNTLVGLFSLVKGRGEQLVKEAVYHGALYLDCFDGYLPAFYAKLGFVEVSRSPNWTAGGPDVVNMRHVSAESSETYEA